MDRRPNVVVVVADDLGVGDLAHVNGGRSRTPALDHLASQGVVLGQHYAASPVCAPARAALLTGRYPQRTGAIDTLETRGLDRLDLREVTLADVLGAAGYVSALVGKWHTGAIGAAFHPLRRGFDEFAGFRGGWQDYWDWSLEIGGRRVDADGRYLTDVLTDLALDVVTRHRDRPFHLHLAYNAPHFPWQAPEADVRAFEAAGRSRGVATLYAMVEVMDRGIGRLLDRLDRLGIADRTIVVFLSDNGPQLTGGDADLERFAAGLRGEKGDVHDGGIRVPAIVRWPDGLEPAVTDAVVHGADWFPTLVAATGTPRPDVLLDGVDALARLRGAPDDGRRHVWQWTRYAPDRRANVAMRDGSWKLVLPARAGRQVVAPLDAEADARHAADPWSFGEDLVVPALPEAVATPTGEPSVAELYDLASDPGERCDLAAAEPQRVRRMLDAIDEWFDAVVAGAPA